MLLNDAIRLADPTVQDVVNMFCPTGDGGGIDPTCSGGEGGGASDIKVSTKQWKAAYDIPADKQVRDVPGLPGTGKAVHMPATSIKVESVYIILQMPKKNEAGHMEGKYLRRRKIRGHWNNPEPVGELPDSVEFPKE